MQYWIVFRPGVGGDGFANLLEHANNVFPADGVDDWRIHYRPGRDGILDRPVRFYQAHWAEDPIPFRYPMLPKSAVLNSVYTGLIAQQKNTVVTAHHHYFNLVDKFEHQHIVKQDRVLINLYSDRAERVYRDLKAKRPETNLNNSIAFAHALKKANFADVNRSDYAMHIDIEKVWRNWSYLNNCLVELGIDLDKKHYDYYLTYIDDL